MGEERRGQTRQRDEARDAADDDEDLQGDRERQARCQQGSEAVAQLLSGADSALEDEEVAQQDDEEPGKADLLTEAGVDEVGFGVGDHIRSALAEAGADESAVGHAEQTLHELVGATGRLVVLLCGQRIEPTGHTLAHMGEEECGGNRAGGEESEAEDDP